MRISSEREQLILSIRDRCVKYVQENGDFWKTTSTRGQPLFARYGAIEMAYTTRFVKYAGFPAPQGLDVWAEINGKTVKVLSVWWDPIKVVSFKNGSWVDVVLTLPE